MFATVFILLATDKVFMAALQHSTLSALEDGCIAHAAEQAGLTGTRPLTVSDYSPSSTAFPLNIVPIATGLLAQLWPAL